jgi:hypothetical protein
MSLFHLAQFNIAWAVAPLDDPRMADHKAGLERTMHLAEKSSGFVWRHPDPLSIRIRDDDRIIVNLSVWESAEALFEFTFHSDHTHYYRRRNEWFTHEDQPFAVLWWMRAGHEPTVEEAEQRLAALKRDDPTADAFTFKQRFAAPAG